MESIDELRRRLDDLRPLAAGDIRTLWQRYHAEMPVYVQGTNAIEGNSLTLGETVVVLQEGVTIGGKTVREHLEVINGAKAFNLMLDMAQDTRPITTNTILAIHELVVAGEAHAGTWRKQNNRITGSRHVTPNWMKVPDLMKHAIESYQESHRTEHPVVAGAELHYAIANIHPFVDGNGRTARLVNNLHLLQHGYTPVLLRLEDRPRYIDALEQSHTVLVNNREPAPFIAFMIDMQEHSLRHYLRTLEQDRDQE
jgi:Fic family protein